VQGVRKPCNTEAGRVKEFLIIIGVGISSDLGKDQRERRCKECSTKHIIRKQEDLENFHYPKKSNSHSWEGKFRRRL